MWWRSQVSPVSFSVRGLAAMMGVVVFPVDATVASIYGLAAMVDVVVFPVDGTVASIHSLAAMMDVVAFPCSTSSVVAGCRH